METKFTQRLSSEIEPSKVTTADLNRFSKAFVGSLKKSGVPTDRIQNCLNEFTEQFPSFINRAAPHTLEGVQERITLVQATISDKLDRHNSPESNKMKAEVTAAFQAGNEALSKKPEATKDGEVTLESVTRLTQVLGNRIKKALPGAESPEALTIDRLARAFPEMINMQGNLPETVEAMQQDINTAKDNVIARLNGRFKMDEKQASMVTHAFSEASRTLKFPQSTRSSPGMA